MNDAYIQGFIEKCTEHGINAAALVKQSQESDPGLLLPAAGTLAGGNYARYLLPSLLGLRRTYHGTDEAAAKKITQQGLKPTLGGKVEHAGGGEWVKSPGAAAKSKGNVFVGRKFPARLHAALAAMYKKEGPIASEAERATRMGLAEVKGLVPGAPISGGKVLTITMPESEFARKFKVEPTLGLENIDAAWKTESKISPKNIGFKNFLRQISPSTIMSEAAKKPTRFMSGATGVGAGTALAAYSIMKLIKSIRAKTQGNKE